MNILNRATAPTSRFFRVLRTVGLALLAASAAIVATPVTGPITLPTVVTTIAGYLAVAGGVLAAVSQVTIPREPDDEDDPDDVD